MVSILDITRVDQMGFWLRKFHAETVTVSPFSCSRAPDSCPGLQQCMGIPKEKIIRSCLDHGKHEETVPSP
ncbi:hypothetical protein SLA2020_168420 [Shorea laevis]